MNYITNEPAGIDLDNAALDKLEAHARSKAGHNSVWLSASKVLALIALARRAPAPVMDERALRQAGKDFYNATVADSEVRITSASKEKRDIAAAAADRLRAALAQQSPAPVVAHDAPRAQSKEESDEIAYANSGYRHFMDFPTFKAFRADCAASPAAAPEAAHADNEQIDLSMIIRLAQDAGFDTEHCTGELLGFATALLAAVAPSDAKGIYTHADITKAHTQGYELGLRQKDAAPATVPSDIVGYIRDNPEMIYNEGKQFSLRKIGKNEGWRALTYAAPEEAHAQQEAAPIHQWRQKPVGSYQPAWYDATKEEAYARVDDHYEARTVYLAAPKAAPDHSEREAANAGGRTFWVVEQFKDGRSSGYWDGGNSRQFTNDIDKAIQFCRHADALWATRGWHWGDTKITEHIILANPATIAAGQEATNAKDAALTSALTKILQTLLYQDREGCWFVGMHGDTDVTDIVGEVMAHAVGAAGQEGGDK